MSFKIAPFAGQNYKGHYADNNDIRAYLGFGSVREYSINGDKYLSVIGKRLPLDFTGEVIVPLVDGRTAKLVCVAGNPSPNGWRGKSSAHRCFVDCPDCGKTVPAGRTHQHKCK